MAVSTRLLTAAYLVTAGSLFSLVAAGPAVRAGALAVLLLAGLLAWAPTARAEHPAASPVEGAGPKASVAAAAAITGAAVISRFATNTGTTTVATMAAYAGLATAAAFAPGRLHWRCVTPAAVFATAHVIVMAASLRARGHHIDVEVFLSHGAQALLEGRNPYSLTFPDIYSAEESARYYGADVVEGGRILYGFPYPPPSLLWAVPGHLFSDVRLSALIALAILAVVFHGRGHSASGRALAVAVLVMPATMQVLAGSWIEPSIVALLGLTVWALQRRHLAPAAVLLGVLLVSKQYMLVALPCLWILRPYVTRRLALIVVGTGAAAVLPFLLVNPTAFWRAVVHWQFVQPLRTDALSLLVSSVNQFGWPSPSTYGVLPLSAGLVVSIAFAWRAQPTPAMFALGVGLALLATVLLSKQAFVNYYFLVGGALLVAAWGVADPTRTPDDGSRSRLACPPRE
jgi:hypothetical protein